MMNNLQTGESDTFPTPNTEYEYIWMKKDLFHAVAALDALELLLCFCYIFAVIFYRKHLIFSATGFPVIFLFILGCVMLLLSVPLFGVDTKLFPPINIPDACMARIWLLSVGFSLSVGVLIVRVLCTTFCKVINDVRNSVISCKTVMLFVGILAIIDTIVVVSWRFRSSPYKEYAVKEVELIGLQDKRVTLVETCSSEKESLLISFLCFYKGGLLLAAVMFSIARDKEQETCNDDFMQCRVGLLSALITSIIAVSVALSLPTNPNTSFAISGVTVVLETAFLMFWIIGNKVMKAYNCKKGESLEFGKYAIQRETRPVPCIRPVYGCIRNESRQGSYIESFAYLDSTSDIQEPDITDTEKPTDGDLMVGVGFDCKQSDDVLPDDLQALDEREMKPYDPDEGEEEEEEVEEVEDELEDQKPEGETSDESDSTSDEEDNKSRSPTEEFGSKNSLVRSAVSVYITKASEESTTETTPTTNINDNDKNNDEEQTSEKRVTSSSSSGKAWWKPLFGLGLFKGPNRKIGSQDLENKETADRRFSEATSGYSYGSSESESSSGTDSSDESD